MNGVESKEVQSRHPSWTVVTPDVGKLDPRRDARAARYIVREQSRRSEALQELLGSKYQGLSTAIGIDQEVFSIPEVCEVAFRNTALDAVTEIVKTRRESEQTDQAINILIVNYGQSHLDTTLPVEMAEEVEKAEENRDSRLNIRFLHNNPSRSSRGRELSVGNSRFSAISEEELAEDATHFDLMLIFGHIDETSYEGMTDLPPQFRAQQLTRLFTTNLKPKGKIITSSSKSLDMLRREILARSGGKTETPGTVFVDPESRTLSYPPHYEDTERVVWSISRERIDSDYSEDETSRRTSGIHLIPRTRKGRIVASTALAGILAASGTAVYFINRAVQSNTSQVCPTGENTIYPQSIVETSPEDTTTNFRRLNGQRFQVATDHGVSTISLYPKQPFTQKAAQYTLDGEEDTIFIRPGGNDLVCAVEVGQTQVPLPSVSASSGSAVIQGAKS